MSAVQQLFLASGEAAKDPYYSNVALLLHMDGEDGASGPVSRGWYGMTVANGNIYCCTAGFDIYMQTGGVGPFVGLGQTSRIWRGMTTLNSDVYACVSNGDIYKQTGGTGNFVALSQTSRLWQGMTTYGSDVYACVDNGDIYKQTGGVGNFVGIGEVSRRWYAMTVLGNDIYACVINGDIYKQTNGTGSFVALGQTSRSWYAMTTLGSDVYAAVSTGDIYKQTGGTGNFVALNQISRAYQGLTTFGNDVYASVFVGSATTGVGIYKQTNGTGDFETATPTLIDSGPNNFNPRIWSFESTSSGITARGSLSTSVKKFGTASLRNLGGYTYVTASRQEFLPYTGDFTVEFWAYAPTLSNVFVFSWGDWLSNAGTVVRLFRETLSSIPYYRIYTTTTGDINLAPYSASTWNYIAVTRQSGVMYFFFNGTLISTHSNTSNFSSSARQIVMLSDNYIDELRLTIGVARYTSSFTPPTEPFPDS